MMKINQFLHEVRGELGKVTWPSREEALRLTSFVVAIAAAVGLFTSAIDYLFSNLTRVLVEK